MKTAGPRNLLLGNILPMPKYAPSKQIKMVALQNMPMTTRQGTKKRGIVLTTPCLVAESEGRTANEIFAVHHVKM